MTDVVLLPTYTWRQVDTFPDLDEMKYNLMYFANTCHETFPVSYDPSQTGSMTIRFSLRVHPTATPFGEYEFSFTHQNQDHFLELEDDNGYLNLHIDFNRNRSTVLPGQPNQAFRPYVPPTHMSASRKDCAVIFVSVSNDHSTKIDIVF
ncbi:hypothetical protein RF11_11402 [Thelohanellus kitauei]|uniref:Uncharacterized protein n=1 Tax=Thelohanellus kitauei TaxID=669202 RepID=A0A0C2J0Y7_THEKT|nr:hypothetical protein RF11_11402 [Thelohanellus kitauei]